ncbi:hypothetical protein JCM10908_003117 [Rhodotorula pacifica]|uniref:uncharacterized protein n=1 Tax=Rhodotorula pacifica TaxID=1495444 RepID=UPI00317F216E
MPTDSSAQPLALPLRPDQISDQEQQELIRSAQQHLVALRTARKLGIRTPKHNDDHVEIVGQSAQEAAQAAREERKQNRRWLFHRRHGRRSDHPQHQHDQATQRGEDNEVDDAWFALPESATHSTVRLSIGNVPRRAAAAITGWKGRGKGRLNETRPTEEDEDEDRYELEDRDATAAGGGEGATAPAAATTTSSDNSSLVTLELPNGVLPGPGDSFSGIDSARPLKRIDSPASLASTTTTTTGTGTTGRLFPVDSAASSSATGGAGTPLDHAPSRTLTIDEHHPGRNGRHRSIHRPRAFRRTTALSMTATPSSSDPDPNNSNNREMGRAHRIPGHRHLNNVLAKRKGRSLGLSAAAAAAMRNNEQAAFELSVAEALKQAGVIQDEEEERVESDVLWEHQRGIVIFGLPKFSGNALFQADPSHWCDGSLKPSPFNPHTFPCKPYWAWRDSEFMIDMSGDKDEEGWSYAIRFRSRFWRGEPQPIRSFVRRRRWIRTRVYRPEPLVPLPVARSQALSNALGLNEVAVHPELGPCGVQEEEEERSSGSSSSASSSHGPTQPWAPINDLRTACAALPLPDEDKMLLFSDSSSPSSFLPGGPIDPRNPFISFREIKLTAAANMRAASAPDGRKASDVEPLWREAVREINYRRAMGVLRARTRVDRQRVELFRLWLGEYDAASKQRRNQTGGESSSSSHQLKVVKADGTEGVHESAQKEGAKAIVAATKVVARKERSEVWDPEAGEGTEADLEDVWDVVENRLDEILLLFDYQTSRRTFLTLLLDTHPIKHAYHRYKGYDAPSAEREATLEKGLESRLAFYETAMELVRQFGGKGGWMPETQETDLEAEREGEDFLA